MQQYSFRHCFAKMLCFYRVFLMFLGVFYAFSASEFTLVFSIPGFLAVGFITILLPAISSYKKVTAVAAAYHDTFRLSSCYKCYITTISCRKLPYISITMFLFSNIISSYCFYTIKLSNFTCF